MRSSFTTYHKRSGVLALGAVLVIPPN